MIQRTAILVSWAATAMAAQSQPDATSPNERMTKAEYIDTYAPHAVAEMLHSGVPASITLAQGMLESGDGNSDLAKKAKNHFGIKCHGMWDGRTYHMDDDARNECFRAYDNVLESYRDHSEFLSKRDRYAFLFELKRDDYKGWAHGLKKAGYATNPKYPELLIRMIEEQDLSKYDHMKEPPKSNGGQGERDKQPAKVQKGPREHAKGQDDAVITTLGRQMYLRNNIRYVRVQKGDDLDNLERILDVRKWQLRRYNDLNGSEKLDEGDILYLQPKRTRNPRHEYHMVAKGEDLRWISQEYGVKMSKLRKYNGLAEGEEPKTGKKIWLRKPRRK